MADASVHANLYREYDKGYRLACSLGGMLQVNSRCAVVSSSRQFSEEKADTPPILSYKPH